MATINLGAIKFNWKGAYNSSTSYAVDDVVSSGGNSYVCIQAHSNQAVGDATAYWNIMSAKGTNGTNGTNGTDLTSTLTTQGDILYRDGSGLQRLPKGTAGQVLQMNSGATAPEYGNVSSDFVKLSTTTLSGVSQFDISSIFDDTTYTAYKIIIKELRGNNGDECHLRMQFKNGSTLMSNNNYEFARHENFSHYANNPAIEHHSDNSSPCVRFSQHTQRTVGGTETGAFDIDFYNFGNNQSAGQMAWRGAFYTGSQGEFYNITGTAFYNHSDAYNMNGVRFYDNNGNNTITGKAIVYGIK